MEMVVPPLELGAELAGVEVAGVEAAPPPLPLSELFEELPQPAIASAKAAATRTKSLVERIGW
jgi:hypothetical protein